MQMRLVGRVDLLPVLQPADDDERRVEDRHGEHEQREEERDRRGGLQEPLDRDGGEDEAEQQRTRVAHEDPCGIEVVAQEADAGAGDDRRHDGRVGLPSESAITQNVMPEIAHTPAASPSRPSRKLTMFMIATIQRIVSGMPTHSGSSWMPMNGKVKRSIQTPNQTGIAAAMSMPDELRARRQPPEVVDRADGRRHRGAEQDAARLTAEIEERERRHEDPEEEGEAAEARDRVDVEPPLLRAHRPRREGGPCRRRRA